MTLLICVFVVLFSLSSHAVVFHLGFKYGFDKACKNFLRDLQKKYDLKLNEFAETMNEGLCDPGIVADCAVYMPNPSVEFRKKPVPVPEQKQGVA